MDERRSEPSLGQLFGDLTRQLTTLIRQEIDLARTEMTAKVGSTARDSALMAVGGALIYASIFALMATVILGLIDAGVTPWLAALIVGVIVAAIGGGLIMVGRNRLASGELAPKRTLETLRDDADWAKERAK
jgi:Putative Actinobacterial Holin-X, holin superfamily III